MYLYYTGEKQQDLESPTRLNHPIPTPDEWGRKMQPLDNHQLKKKKDKQRTSLGVRKVLELNDNKLR